MMRTMALAGAVAMGCAAVAAEPPESGDLMVTLEGGAGPARTTAAPDAPADMVLDLVLRDGRVEDELWGSAVWFNRGQHRGRVTRIERRAGAMRLAVTMTIESCGGVPGGPAEYEIDLSRERPASPALAADGGSRRAGTGPAWAGTFAGTFLERAVQGKAAGRLREPVVRPVPGFVPLGPGEHPRLIFRPRDRPRLRERLQTPEGKAILSMLTVRAPLRDPRQVTDRRASWMAANWGAIYQLTGDREAAEKARRLLMDEVVKKPLPADRADIHLAPRLLGAALAYDLAADAWDEPFRGLAAAYLREATLDLWRGTNDGLRIEGFNPDPWGHANAIRMGSVGCAALALLGEAGPSGDVLAEAPAIVMAAERSIVQYLTWGLAQSGAGMEGEFLKALALSNGVLQFMHASRVARGRDLGAANPFLLAGHVLEAVEAAEGGLDLGLSSISIQASGRWPMGLSTVPAGFLPAMKWAFDRDAGLLGKKHFDCAYPYQAAYAIANYPFDTVARPPAEGLPAAVFDPVQGRCVFRNTYKNADDIVTVLNLRALPLVGLARKESPPAGEVRIAGLGRDWIAGRPGLAAKNAFFGGDLVLAQSPRPGQAAVTARLDRMYLQDVTPRPTGRRPRKEPGAPPEPPDLPAGPDIIRLPEAPGAYKDLGIRCTRHFAVDYSGASGAPALFVLIDRPEGAADETWDLGLRAALRGGRFTLADPAAPGQSPAGTSLTGVVAAPADARGSRFKATGPCFLVFTIQRGQAPAFKVEGEGLGATVAVGGQTVRFDPAGPGRVVFGK